MQASTPSATRGSVPAAVIHLNRWAEAHPQRNHPRLKSVFQRELHNAGLIHTRDFSEGWIVQGRIWIQSPNSIWQIKSLRPKFELLLFLYLENARHRCIEAPGPHTERRELTHIAVRAWRWIRERVLVEDDRIVFLRARQVSVSKNLVRGFSSKPCQCPVHARCNGQISARSHTVDGREFPVRSHRPQPAAFKARRRSDCGEIQDLPPVRPAISSIPADLKSPVRVGNRVVRAIADAVRPRVIAVDGNTAEVAAY